MIIIYEGRPGSGKSYQAVQEICYDLSRGCIVHTNILVIPDAITKFVYRRYGVHIDPSSLVHHSSGGELWKNFTDICPRGTRELPNKIYMDEAHKWANSREWKENYRDFKGNLIFCTEHRHFHIDINFISQDANNIDAQFRRLCQFYKRYRDLAKVSIPFVGRVYPLAHTMEIIIDYDGKTKMGQSIIPRNSEGFSLYVSEQAGIEEAFAPLTMRGKIRVDKSRQWIGVFERLGFWFIILGGLLCVLSLLW